MKTSKMVVALCLMGGLSSTAFAGHGSGAFVGVSLGGVGYDMDHINGLTKTGTTEHVRTAAKVSVGYWFNRYWGVSGSYINASQFSQTFSEGRFDGQGDSFGISLLGRVPLNEKWTLIGRLSLTRNKLRQDDSSSNVAQFEELRGRSTNVVLPGLEIGYRYSDKTTIFFELDPRGSASDKVSLGYAGFGLRWSF